MEKARDIIINARQELYVRLFPETGHEFEKHLKDASARSVGIRYITMGDIPSVLIARSSIQDRMESAKKLVASQLTLLPTIE